MPVPVSPPDQHRSIAPRHSADGLVHVLHCQSVADDPVGWIRSLQLYPELLDLGSQLLIVEEPTHREEDVVQFKGLRDIVEGTQLDRLDGGVRGAVSGHQQNWDLEILLAQLLHDFDPIPFGHPEVHDQEIRG